MSPLALILDLLGVLVAALLLGLAAWGVGIAILAWVVTRAALGPFVLARAAAGLTVAAIVYVGLALALALALPA